MQDFRRLAIWQKAHTLTLALYKETKSFPKTEIYSLTSQIRRAVSSIPTNIAEGSVQGSDAQFARFLHIALGSAAELDYLLLLSRELEYVHSVAYEQYRFEVDQIKKMLTAFIRKLKA